MSRPAWYVEPCVISDQIAPATRGGQNSHLLRFYRYRDDKLKISIRIDHFIAQQGHASLYRWTSEGWKEFVSIHAPRADRTEESLRELQRTLEKMYEDMVDESV